MIWRKYNMGDPQNHDEIGIDTEKPCEICGDVGFVNAIRDCSLCQNTREHAYCMKVMHEPEADTWICEDCESAKITLSGPAPSNQPEDARPSLMIKKSPQNTKVKYITPEEVIVLESRANKLHLSSRSSMNKASFPNTGLAALASNSSAEPGPQIGAPGFKKSLNAEKGCVPHLGKNIPTAEPCTSGDLVKHNTEKYSIHSMNTLFQLVQCLPAVDLVLQRLFMSWWLLRFSVWLLIDV